MRLEGHRKPTLYIMARLPVAGAVKTRLARQVGVTEAVRLYRALLCDTLRAARDPRWRVVLAVTPAPARFSRLWRRIAPGVQVVTQAPGGLGLRMAQLLTRGGRSPAAVIGTDTLGLKAFHIAASFDALRGADAVLSPAEDGGFWMCAVQGTLRRFPARGEGAFVGVVWSRDDTCAETRAALERAGFKVASGPLLADLDEAPSRRAPP